VVLSDCRVKQSVIDCLTVLPICNVGLHGLQDTVIHGKMRDFALRWSTDVFVAAGTKRLRGIEIPERCDAVPCSAVCVTLVRKAQNVGSGAKEQQCKLLDGVQQQIIFPWIFTEITN
jgi:hypothetical protein